MRIALKRWLVSGEVATALSAVERLVEAVRALPIESADDAAALHARVWTEATEWMARRRPTTRLIKSPHATASGRTLRRAWRSSEVFEF